MSRVRNAVLVLNNYTDDDLEAIEEFGPRLRFLVFGRETSSTGTDHLQAYAEFWEKMSYAAIRDLFHKKDVHIEPRRGTAKEAAGYCMKGTQKAAVGDYAKFFDNPADDWDGQLYGTLSQQGKRSDLTAPIELIQNGGTLTEVADQFPVEHVKYFKGLREYFNSQLKPRRLSKAPEVHVLWGPTGTGKTWDAYHQFWPDEPAYEWTPDNGAWFDGYEGEKKIILEEFRGCPMKWTTLLKLLDRYPFRVPVKGGFVQIQADKFVITSPMPPSQWYHDDSRYDKMAQLERRITEVHEYTAADSRRVPLSDITNCEISDLPINPAFDQFDDQ